jgi:hypothetical protein
VKLGKTNKIIQKLVCLGYIFFFGLRGYVVGDVFVYNDWFDSLPTLFSDGFFDYFKTFKLDFGFSFLMILTKTFWNNYLFFQFINSVLNIVLLDIVIRRYSKKYYVLAFLFFFVFGGIFLGFNLIRNYLSIMLFIVSLKYIESRNFIKYLLLNFLGFTIHFSSLLFIPFYFLLKTDIKKIWFWMFFILGVILFIAKVEYLNKVFDILGVLLPSRIGHIVDFYATRNIAPIADFSISMGFFERGFSFVLIILLYNSFYKNISTHVFMNIMLIYVISFYYFGEFAGMMGRFMYLFVCYYWFLFPMLFEKLKKEGKLFFLLFIVVVGISKTFLQTNSILFKYDNIIFGIENIETRRQAMARNM